MPAGGKSVRGFRKTRNNMQSGNWGVALYVLAVIAAITVPVALTACDTALLFQQPSPDDLLRSMRTVLPMHVRLE